MSLLARVAQFIVGLLIQKKVDKFGKIKMVFVLSTLASLTTPLIGLASNFYQLLFFIFLNSMFQGYDVCLRSAFRLWSGNKQQTDLNVNITEATATSGSLMSIPIMVFLWLLTGGNL